MRGAVSAAVVGCVSCFLGVVVTTETAAQPHIVQRAKEDVARARVIASAAGATAAIADCDYDKWVEQRKAYEAAADVFGSQYGVAWAPPGLPVFPTYPFPCSPQIKPKPASVAPVTTPSHTMPTTPPQPPSEEGGFIWPPRDGSFRTAGTFVEFGGSVSATYGINVANGGLGGKQDLIGGGFAAGISSEPREPSEWHVMAFGQWGTLSEADAFGPSAGNRVFVQSPGTTQIVPGFLQGVSRIEADTSHFGLGAQIGLGRPAMLPGGGRLSPFVGFGVEYLSLDTRLRADYSSINFVIDTETDTRAVRANIVGGVKFDIPLSPQTNLFWRGQVQLNADFVDGQSSYFTQQIGNFSSLQVVSDSTVGLTFGGRLTGGTVTTFSNGVQFEFNTMVGVVPWWEMESRLGQPATLTPTYVLNYGGAFAVRVPTVWFRDVLDGRRTDPFTGRPLPSR
jgi:hypothetical protein